MKALRILVTVALTVLSAGVVATAANAAPAGCATTSAARPKALPRLTIWLAGDSTMANPSGGVCPVGWGTLYTRLGLCPNNGDYTSGAVGAFFCNDHTHFEAAGALQIAKLVAGAVRDQGLGLAAYLK